MCCLVFFFVKQKTAYAVRISDWSSDVCSSDLFPTAAPDFPPMRMIAHLSDLHLGRIDERVVTALLADLASAPPNLIVISGDLKQRAKNSQFAAARSEERRVGKECVSTCRSRWSQYH